MTLSSWFDVSAIVGHLADFRLKMAELSHCRHRTPSLSLNTAAPTWPRRGDVASSATTFLAIRHKRATMESRSDCSAGASSRTNLLAVYCSCRLCFATSGSCTRPGIRTLCALCRTAWTWFWAALCALCCRDQLGTWVPAFTR